MQDAVPYVLPREAISGPTGCDGIPGGSRVNYCPAMGMEPYGELEG